MREKLSEWWEVWIRVPGKPPVRVRRNGQPQDERIPHEGFVSKEDTKEWTETNRYAHVVHVTRFKKGTRRSAIGDTVDDASINEPAVSVRKVGMTFLVTSRAPSGARRVVANCESFELALVLVNWIRKNPD